MACCGGPNKDKDFDKKLKILRNKPEEISVNLDNLKLTFIPDSSKWESNYKNLIIYLFFKYLFFNFSEYQGYFSWIFICNRRKK